jgi:hypothetical protein
MNVGEFLDKYDSGFDEAFLETGAETLAILERKMDQKYQRNAF